ncbi:hypothetical protein GCM10027614_60340 [Micromonospora vulcania]
MDVVVPGRDQPGHVEQPPVDPSGADQRQGILRQHGEVAVLAAGEEANVRTPGAGLDGGGAGRGDGDPVPGEQGDGARRRGAGRGSGGRVRGVGGGGWTGDGGRRATQHEGDYGDGGDSLTSMQRILLDGASLPREMH